MWWAFVNNYIPAFSSVVFLWTQEHIEWSLNISFFLLQVNSPFFELSITALSMLTPALLGYSGDGKHPDDVEGNTGQYLAF